MTINIKKTGGKYTAEVTPPHGNNSNWVTNVPLSCNDLIKRLNQLGCHQTDIGDAFYKANPEWLNDND